MDRTANAENAFKCSVGSNPTLSALVLVQDSGDDPSLTVRIVSRFAVARGVGARRSWGRKLGRAELGRGQAERRSGKWGSWAGGWCGGARVRPWEPSRCVLAEEVGRLGWRVVR